MINLSPFLSIQLLVFCLQTVDNYLFLFLLNILTLVTKQAKTAFLHGPTVCKLSIVGIEPATFCSEIAALSTSTTEITTLSQTFLENGFVEVNRP